MGTRTFSAAALLLALVGAPANGADAAALHRGGHARDHRHSPAVSRSPISSTGRWIAYVLTDMDDEWNVQEGRPTGYVSVQTLGAARSARRARSRPAPRTARFRCGRPTAAASRSSVKRRAAGAW